MHELRRIVTGLAVVAATAGSALVVAAGPAGATGLATNGSGTMTVAPHVVKTSSANNFKFTYTAEGPSSTTAALTNGKLEIVVPATWTPPQRSSTTQPGYVVTTCKNTSGSSSTITVATSMTIKITTVKLDYGGSCTITYGSGGPGDADAPATPGTDHFTVSEVSTSTGTTFTPLTPAYVKVGVGNPGTGTMTISSGDSLAATSTGNTITLTYTAKTGGLTKGLLGFYPLPTGYPAASVTSSAAGYTTTTCTGTVSPFAGGLDIKTLVLAKGSTCTVTYGSRSGGGPGLTAPSGTGAESFVVSETPVGSTDTHHISSTLKEWVYGKNGGGTMPVTPAVTTPSTPGTFTFNFEQPSGSVTHGKVQLTVPSGWTAPTTGTGHGKVTTTCGPTHTVTVTGPTITVTVTGTCQILYGAGGGSDAAVPPATTGTYTFSAKEASVSDPGANGTLTSLASSPVIRVGASGLGSITPPTPTGVPASASGIELEFIFKAASGGLTHGKLSLLVPSPWPAPVTGTSAGKVLSTCGTVGITGGTSRTITVSTVTKGSGATCRIFYGATPHTVSAPSTTGSYTFAAKEASTSGASLASLASSPAVTVLAPNGSGTLTVSPSSVTPSSTGNTLTFTYTAATGGVAGGFVTIEIPTGWSRPQYTTSGVPGFVTTDCGYLTIFTSAGHFFISPYALYLSGGHSCTITYGEGGGASAVTAPATAGTYTFTASEGSATPGAGGVGSALASSPTVSVSSSSGSAPPGSSSSNTGTSKTGTATTSDDGNSATATGGKGTVTLAQYPKDPEGAPTFTSSGEYFDVQLSSGNTFSHITVTVGHTNGGNLLYWWNPTVDRGSGAWEAVSPVKVKTGNLVATLSTTSSPTLKQLTGTVFAVGRSSSPTPPPAASKTQGYWLAGSDGGVFSFGDAGYYGSVPGDGIHVSDIVGMARAGSSGYWLAGSDGGVFSFGDAGYHGSVPGDRIHVSDIVAIVSSPDGKGYWLVGRDGGVFSFGDAHYFGSVPGDGIHTGDVVGMAATPDGGGYWLVGRDGGVFSFGDAAYHGSVPGDHVHTAGVVGMAATPDGGGYWLVGRDGGVFTFGDAAYHGSVPGDHVSVSDAIGLVGAPTGGGYWVMTKTGQVFDFGAATAEGTASGKPLAAPVVGAAGA